MSRSLVIKHFTSEEIAAMVEAAPCLWWKAFIDLAVSSGLRVQEILRLHSADINERTLSVRITSDPTDSCRDTEQVTLRQWMPTHRERIVPVSAETMHTLVRLRSERASDSHIFVPDWKLDQLWPLLEKRLTSEQLSPGISAWFQMIQRRGRLVLAKDRAVPLSSIRWHQRDLRALRTTAIRSLAEQLSPRRLAEHLGYASSGPVLSYYERTPANTVGGAT